MAFIILWVLLMNHSSLSSAFLHPSAPSHRRLRTLRAKDEKKVVSKGFSKGFGSKTETSMSPKLANVPVSTPPSNFNITREGSGDIVLTFLPCLDLHYPGIRCIHHDPPIFEIDDFFPPSLCDDYILRAETQGLLIPSQTFSRDTSTKRTSTTWFLKYADTPEFIYRANKLLGKPITTFEEPQVVRYEMGQQFSWHYDAIPKSQLDESGQRVATLLVYLNDVKSGGATCFKDLNIQVRPQKGKALLFFPSQLDGKSDDRTMHAGQVAMDTKFIAQMWIHERDYSPALPEGTNHQDGIEAIKKLQL